MKLFKLTALSFAVALAGCGDDNSGSSNNTNSNSAPEVMVQSKALTQADIKAGAVVGKLESKDADGDDVSVTLNSNSQTYYRIDGDNVMLTDAGAAYILQNYTFENFSYAMSATDGKVYVPKVGKFTVTERREPAQPAKAKLFSDDFESGKLDKWTAVSLSGGNDWVVESYGGNKFAVGNCYESEGDCDDWLVSPKIDLSKLTDPKLEFVTAWNYGKNSKDQLKVKISTDFAGDVTTATWTDITDKAALSEGNFKFTPSGEMDLSQFANQGIFLAFHYKSTVADAAKWEVDSVAVFGEGELALSAKLNAPTAAVFAGRDYGFGAVAENGAGGYTYAWDFGDGTTATGEKVMHTYAGAGNYQVQLTVTDKAGKTVIQTQQVTVAQQTAYTVPAKKGDFRIATFNVGLDRFKKAGEMATALESGNDAQAKKVAEIIQRAGADVLLINEIDGNDEQKTLKTFMDKYLAVSQNNANPANYAHVYMSDCNTGVPSGKDYDNNGKTTDAGDAYGFGNYPGQYCMAILSKYPLDTAKARTFQKFLWKDMPSALRPANPDGSQWYSDDAWSSFRLSSKTHIDLPVTISGKTVHVLASHPTPPVFDGKEDRNGKRNFDEIRLWADYIDPAKGGYLYDDSGEQASLAKDTRFVIMGDENASSVEGDAAKSGGVTAIDQLLKSSLVSPKLSESAADAMIPMSDAGAENAPKSNYGKYHTAAWKMRADYVLPSAYGLSMVQSGVFWPKASDDLYYLVSASSKDDRSSSDHRMVWVDLTIK